MIIKDWLPKREAIRLLLNVMSNNAAAEQIFYSYNSGNKFGFSLDNLLRNYLYNWKGNGNPLKETSNFRHFFQVASVELGLNEEIPGFQIVYGSIQDFIKTFPDEHLNRLVNAVKNNEIIDDDIKGIISSALNEVVTNKSEVKKVEKNTCNIPIKETSKVWHPIWHKKGEKKKTIEYGYFTKSIDQSTFYQTPQSVIKWSEIIEHPLYDGFDACKSTLKRLVKTNNWNKFIQSPDYGGNIVLTGGGAPDKDLIITSSIVTKKNKSTPILHALIDTSSYMLHYSIEMIDERLNSNLMHLRDLIEFKFLECDIFQLCDLSWLKDKNKNYCWFLPGGTLGNLSEKEVFTLLQSRSNSGDMVVLGVSTVPEVDDKSAIENLKEKLRAEYQSDSIKKLVEAPIHSLCGIIHDNNSYIDDIMSSWFIEIHEGVGEHSDVEGALTPVATVRLRNDEKLELFKSSRYRVKLLVKLANEYGFELVESIAQENYSQVVLVKL